MELIVSNEKELQINLDILEYAIIAHFRPVFLYISKPHSNGTIEVIISCVKFNYIPIEQRILETFKLINDKIPVILEKHLLIIQCYSTTQMEMLLEDTFE